MKKIILGLLVFIIAVISYVYYSIFVYKKNIDFTFIVNNGETISQISDNLRKNGIISNSFIFKYYFNFSSDKPIKSGKYIFLGSYNLPKISETLTTKVQSNIKTQKLTIIEGWNKYDISEYLSKNTKYKYDEILKFIDDKYKTSVIFDKYEFLKNENIFNLEGFLYPDTYEIFENASIETIFSKFLDNFKSKVIDTYGIKNFNTLYNNIVMASVIEKEAKLDSDRPIVASVINNRIAKHMRLEMDSTIVYFTGNRDNEEIAEDKWTINDYNTYRKWGLPIGPISNPGIASIDAAINPKNTDYYYFVNKKSGEAVFSKTFEEHKINIAKYLY